MKKHSKKIIYLVYIVVAFLTLSFYLLNKDGITLTPFFKAINNISKTVSWSAQNKEELKLEKLIAHAAGEIKSISSTNSLEALDKNYANGFRFIELDFEWTSDEHLVLIHDWKKSMTRLFNESPGNYTLREYENLNMINGLTQMTLDDLAKWVRRHQDVYIVTDIKRYNSKGLRLISDRFPGIVGNFIPQIYYFQEYWLARKMGYKHIILTLYRSEYSDEEILSFVSKNYLAAVTMPIKRANTRLPAKLKQMGVSTYAHTVNTVSLQNQLYTNDVFGVYTDSLNP
ncbi:MAG TPA: amidohydrolase [Candidatus Omnitrophica bacterium]|nr:amidohydrolase [Candidatus Omnitrophota bacterium]